MESADLATSSPEEIYRLMASISDLQDGEWKRKTVSLYNMIQKKEQLEAAGKAATPYQLLEIISSSQGSDTEKLSAVLIGSPPLIFRRMLSLASQEQIQQLKKESGLEPLQYHLTRLLHEIGNEIDESTQAMAEIEADIDQVDPEYYSKADADLLISRLDKIARRFQNSLDEVNLLLGIAWNTNRADLIEKLNGIKDIYQKFSALVIGNPRSHSSLPTGFYAKLEEKLLSIYGNPLNPKDVEALQDDEPAMEALGKLSIWYLKDYWEIGLLPAITSIDQLSLKGEHSEQERATYRDCLFAEAKRNLEMAGLATVRDLKTAFIFSKQTLKDYLASR